MPQLVSAQIRLRRAFRYGYFAFLAGAALVLTLLTLLVLNRGAVAILNAPFSDMSVWPMMALLLLGLCVPLFFACWLLVATAVLRRSA